MDGGLALIPIPTCTYLVCTPNTTETLPVVFKRAWEIQNRDDYFAEMDAFFEHPCMQIILDRIHASDLEDCNPMSLIPYEQMGYVYVAWNPLFGDLVKIGATMRSKPYIRVAELSGTGVPEPFQLVAAIPSKNPFGLEQEIHEHYKEVRKYGRKKEFFLLSRDEVIEHFHFRTLTSIAGSLREKKRSKQGGFKSGRGRSMVQKVKAHMHEKRAHVRKLPEEKDRLEFQSSIDQFIRNEIQLKPLEFTPTQAIMEAFIAKGNQIHSATLFTKEFVKQMAKKYPDVNRIRVDQVRGYRGISMM